jgi:hypothetical protein
VRQTPEGATSRALMARRGARRRKGQEEMNAEDL